MGHAAKKRQTSARKRSRRQRPIPPAQQRQSIGLFREGLTLALFVFGVFVGTALLSFFFADGQTPQQNSMGYLGVTLATLLSELLGWCSFVVAIWAFLAARKVWTGDAEDSSSLRETVNAIVGSFVMLASAATIVAVLFGASGGGTVGATLAFWLVQYVSEAGAVLISLASLFLALSLSTGIGTAAALYGLSYVLKLCQTLFRDTMFFLGEVCVWSARLFRTCFLHLIRVSGLTSRAFVQLFAIVVARVRGRRAVEPEPATQKRTTPKPAVEEPWVLGESNAAKGEPRVRHATKSVDAESPATPRIEKPKIEKPKKRKQRRTKRAASTTTVRPQTKKEKRQFELPPLRLLTAADESESHAPDDATLIENSKRLEQALADFKIGGRVVEVQPGPVITLYQFSPAAGVKAQRVLNLADDLALTLRVASVRVYAPVPGKGTIGIEVPNEHREMVRLHAVLASDEFRNTKAELMLGMGKDTFGNSYVANLSRMPHLLIAGATGTGKSVFINALLMSLLYRNTPEELRLIMIDPKMLELSIYEGIPHLKAPVVTNPKRARGALWWAVEEMERRYALMKDLGVRNLASYNAVARGENDEVAQARSRGEKVIELRAKDVIATTQDGAPLVGVDDDPDTESITPPPGSIQLEVLPRIVIVVDELADLMLTVGREVEELFTRLAQKARAAGIHLVLATQRPSVNVITGLIKANFPARLSFKVTSRVDSRTVMDEIGAERLLGDGDLLFFSPYTRGTRRLHGAFVSDSEVASVVEYLKKQGPPEYDEAIERTIEAVDKGDDSKGGGRDTDECDPLYDEAVNLVIDKGTASTSMVQRAFRIGYNRAARILEMMEQEGVVGPADGSRPREVLVHSPEA